MCYLSLLKMCIFQDNQGVLWNQFKIEGVTRCVYMVLNYRTSSDTSYEHVFSWLSKHLSMHWYWFPTLVKRLNLAITLLIEPLCWTKVGVADMDYVIDRGWQHLGSSLNQFVKLFWNTLAFHLALFKLELP